MFRGESIRVDILSDGIAELCFDRRGDAVNKFDRRTVDELKAATAAIRAAAGVGGVLVTSAKDAFIVGADIFEFSELFSKPEAEIAAFNAEQNVAFREFEDLPVPIVTAINGFALGGGFEMALASDYRVMSATAQVGLPEVSLGLFPGFGGTVRLPRLAGAATAIDWIASGKPQKAEAALATGAVDAVVAPEQLRSAALAWLSKVVTSSEWKARRRRNGSLTAEAAMFGAAKSALAKTAVQQPAALAAVELMERAAPLPRDEALKLEHAAFAKIAKTQAAASLVQIFANDQLLKKKGRAYAKLARKLDRAAVLGAGIMGGGIAYTSAVRGVPVIMKDIAQKQLDLGTGEAKKLLAKQVEGGRMKSDKADAVLASIKPALDFSGFESVDAVVEAVVEKLEVKKKVLAEVEALVKADAVIASNTSSLSIAEMATVLQRPDNFVGMHFFNPVPVMPLVEVIKGPKTSEVAAATIAGYAAAMGKTPIVVQDCPGFLVNRILNAYMIGFLRTLHDGADYLAVDRAMEKFGWPMGPAYLQDVVGMDTLVHVLEVISAGYPKRQKLDFPYASRLLAERQRLGQKSGAGYYRYETDPKGKPKKTVDPDTAGLLTTIQPHGRKDFSDTELVERLMLPMIIEAALCIEQGIVQTAAEVDMALILGLGFPRHVGGPLQYADWLGLAHVVKRCQAYAALGPLYAPSTGMLQMASKGTAFHARNA